MKSAHGLRGMAAVLVMIAGGGMEARLAAASDPAPAKLPAGRWQDSTVLGYEQHLAALQKLTGACVAGRDLKTCDPTLVGPDDRIPLKQGQNSEKRMVRYGWLRLLFSRAEESDQAAQPPDARKTVAAGQDRSASQPTTSQLLMDAGERLAFDLAQAEKSTTVVAAHPGERDVLKQVLAGREFVGLQQSSEKDTALEKFENWLNHAFAGFGRLRARSAWVGRALVWGFFAVVGVGLAWGLLQIERRWRVRLVPLPDGPSPEAPSARDWQLWLADARRAAGEGRWREAVHFVYWAAVARLEARRLWPADRARTPREYLALIDPDDPRRAGLATLTGSFERIWYGGKDAGESEYRQAESLATSLMSGSASADGRQV